MRNLALQVGQVQRVEVGQMQFANPCSREIQRHRRAEPAEAEPAEADDQRPALLEAQLPLDIDLLEQDLPAVTQQFFVTQHQAPRVTERSWQPPETDALVAAQVAAAFARLEAVRRHQ